MQATAVIATPTGAAGTKNQYTTSNNRNKNRDRGWNHKRGVAAEHRKQTNTIPWNAPVRNDHLWSSQPNNTNDPSPWVKVNNFVNPAQPYINEFPGTLCWTTEDEVVSSVITLKRGGKHYLRGKEIGSGGFAWVYKVLRKSDGKLLAGKSCKKADFIDKLLEERREMARFQHDHILQWEDYFVGDQKNHETFMLLTEFCAGGNLWDYLNAVTKLSPDQVFRVIKQMASALDYMHSKNFIHADIKPRNIMIRSFRPMNVVLGDLADVVELPNVFGGWVGTRMFNAPEVIANKQNMGPPEDIWALGCSTLNMVGLTPRVMVMKSGLKDMKMLDNYPKQCSELVDDLVQLNPGHGIVDLLDRMLTWDAEERITAKALCQLAQKVQAVWGDNPVLGIEAPADFMPVEFW